MFLVAQIIRILAVVPGIGIVHNSRNEVFISKVKDGEFVAESLFFIWPKVGQVA